jgi:hypothetical protein
MTSRPASPASKNDSGAIHAGGECILADPVIKLSCKFLSRLFLVWEKGCGAYGIRTRDLLNAIEALYQLS